MSELQLKVLHTVERVLWEPCSHCVVLALISSGVRRSSTGLPLDLAVDWFLVRVVVVYNEYCMVLMPSTISIEFDIPLSVLL